MNSFKMMLSYIKLMSGVVFWICPFYFMLLQLPVLVERGFSRAWVIAGVALYSSAIALRILNGQSSVRDLLLFNLVLVPVCLLLCAAEMFVLTLFSIRIYGLPSDIF